MSMVKRVLLVINRTAGTGHRDRIGDRLRAMLAASLGEQVTLQVEVVADHPTAKACARVFLMSCAAPAAIIVGGGGGTLRAVIEGVCEGSTAGRLPGRERVRLAALRMGSGNVLARQFGVPRDPEAGLKSIITNLQADRTAPCCIMRYEVGNRHGLTETHYAATLCGLGQFGRIPGDLARLHRRWPKLHKATARALGVERLTNVEYAVALLTRSLLCALSAGSSEVVEARINSRKESVRLFAGVVMNFPLQSVPVNPGVRVEDEVLSAHLIPLEGRLSALPLLLNPGTLNQAARRIRIEKAESVEIRLVDRDCAELFLDEDPMIVHGKVTVQVAGSLAFVPGSDYPDYRK